MTIKDIARESGYAVGTVSRVLNNNPRVSEDARRKILAVVAQHGYQPNANAKHLKQQVPEGLSLIVKGTQNALFADLLDKLQPCLEARGYTRRRSTTTTAVPTSWPAHRPSLPSAGPAASFSSVRTRNALPRRWRCWASPACC